MSINTVNDAIVHMLTEGSWKDFVARNINRGDCDSFAMDLWDHFPDGEVFWGNEIASLFDASYEPEAHCFFVHGGLYYDSECPTGVDKPTDLPFYKRQSAYILNAAANAKHSSTNPFPTRKDGSVGFCP